MHNCLTQGMNSLFMVRIKKCVKSQKMYLFEKDAMRILHV